LTAPAARGFIAVAPDLFWRDAPGLDLNGSRVWRCGVRDVAATIEAAKTIGGGSGKVGVMGFCLGESLRSTDHRPRLPPGLLCETGTGTVCNRSLGGAGLVEVHIDCFYQSFI
jgi:hypothetical protein